MARDRSRDIATANAAERQVRIQNPAMSAATDIVSQAGLLRDLVGTRGQMPNYGIGNRPWTAEDVQKTKVGHLVAKVRAA